MNNAEALKSMSTWISPMILKFSASKSTFKVTSRYPSSTSTSGSKNLFLTRHTRRPVDDFLRRCPVSPIDLQRQRLPTTGGHAGMRTLARSCSKGLANFRANTPDRWNHALPSHQRTRRPTPLETAPCRHHFLTIFLPRSSCHRSILLLPSQLLSPTPHHTHNQRRKNQTRLVVGLRPSTIRLAIPFP